MVKKHTELSPDTKVSELDGTGQAPAPLESGTIGQTPVVLEPKPTGRESAGLATLPEESPERSSLEDILGSNDPSTIIKKQTVVEVTSNQITEILRKIQKTKDIGFTATAHGVSALFRKGAANAGAADSMQVEISCPETGISTDITRYDVIMALNGVANHKNLRKLAEAMAPAMVSANLRLLKANPLADLKGDLANRINRKLTLRKEPPLTREEEICCSTYAQWMPNLNDLANSTRLTNLLNEDLNARRKRTSKKVDTSNNKTNNSKTNVFKKKTLDKPSEKKR